MAEVPDFGAFTDLAAFVDYGSFVGEKLHEDVLVLWCCGILVFWFYGILVFWLSQD